jgi:dTDP-4-amino-4,6-dideoxygalactose transaminase
VDQPDQLCRLGQLPLYCGAQVDFVDVEPDTGNLSAPHLERKSSEAQAEGTLPKGVIPVHFAGLPCDMQAIHA